MLLTRIRDPRRPGNVVVVTAASMVCLMSFVALSLDGGMLLDKRRKAQAASDAAAYAAACELYANWFTNAGLDDSNTTAKKLAKQVASDNGFTDGVNGVTVTVNIPPQSGPFSGQKGHVEVLISASQSRYFSNIFGDRSAIPIGSRSVCRGMRSTNDNGIIVLDPALKGAFSNGGGGVATVSGAPVIVNSINGQAMIANGGGTVTATKGYKVGGSPGWATPGGGSFSGPITSNSTPTPDPLRFLSEPTQVNGVWTLPDGTTLKVQSTKKIQQSSANTLNLQPGVYQGGISITGKGDVSLAPGVYVMDGGGFSISGQGNLSGTGVMIYNAPTSNSDVINLAGTSTNTITLSPPTSGPYQGLSVFQQRDAVIQPTVSISGSGGVMAISGTFYVPGGNLSITGNGNQNTIGSQYISDQLTLGGNGSFKVDWNPSVIPGIRSIYLVE